MSKWSGKIGFAEQKETSPGVWTEVIKERSYKGDLLLTSFRNQSGDQVLDHLTITNRISIVADLHANQNLPMMRYATYKGSRWEITSVEGVYPRIILSLGGVYNGQAN